jgi:hypothetical protein
LASAMLLWSSDFAVSLTIHFLNPEFLHWITPYTGRVGNYFERFSIIIHGRIAEALAKDSIKNQSKNSHQLLQFLVIVNIVHEFAHIARSFIHKNELDTMEVKDHPYAIELGNSLFALRFTEGGFQAEKELFGGTVGIVFEDEIDGERPPFFNIEYDKISHFFLLCADGKAYCLGEHHSLHWVWIFKTTWKDSCCMLRRSWHCRSQDGVWTVDPVWHWNTAQYSCSKVA